MAGSLMAISMFFWGFIVIVYISAVMSQHNPMQPVLEHPRWTWPGYLLLYATFYAILLCLAALLLYPVYYFVLVR